MPTKTATQEKKNNNAHSAVPSGEKVGKSAGEHGIHLDSLLAEGSWQRVAVGVGAAAGGGLLAAALVGVGPAALAGTAGYLAYRGLKGQSHPRGHE